MLWLPLDHLISLHFSTLFFSSFTPAHLTLVSSSQGPCGAWLHTGDQHCTCCAFVVDFRCFTRVLARGPQVGATIVEGGAEVLKGPNNSLKGPPNEGTNNLLIKLHSLLQG